MDEYIEIRFRKNSRALAIKRRLPGGIHLDEPDPIERTVYISLDSANDISRHRMRYVAQLQGWEPGQFRLKMSVEDGALRLRGVDERSLPAGRYTVRVRLEEAETRERHRTVDVPEDGHAVLLVDVKTDDRQAQVDLSLCDDGVRRILDASTIDGQGAIAWLDDGKRATKKACLLNVLASLRTRPRLADPLIADVLNVFWASNDRVYARVGHGLRRKLEILASDSSKHFYREGRPRSNVHFRLLENLPEPADVGIKFLPSGLVSFRGKGRPSLQVVVADAPAGLPYTYAEFDLDLGNALQDVVGFVTHVGELLDGKPTNHLDLRKEIARTTAGKFLYYRVARA